MWDIHKFFFKKKKKKKRVWDSPKIFERRRRMREIEREKTMK
jgi:hypothetical protein